MPQCIFIYPFVLLFYRVFCILVFYHIPFVTLSAYSIYIFLSLFIFSRVILLLICKALFILFKLENDLSEIETQQTFFTSLYLKMSFNCLFDVSTWRNTSPDKIFLAWDIYEERETDTTLLDKLTNKPKYKQQKQEKPNRQNTKTLKKRKYQEEGKIYLLYFKSLNCLCIILCGAIRGSQNVQFCLNWQLNIQKKLPRERNSWSSMQQSVQVMPGGIPRAYSNANYKVISPVKLFTSNGLSQQLLYDKQQLPSNLNFQCQNLQPRGCISFVYFDKIGNGEWNLTRLYVKLSVVKFKGS